MRKAYSSWQHLRACRRAVSRDYWHDNEESALEIVESNVHLFMSSARDLSKSEEDERMAIVSRKVVFKTFMKKGRGCIGRFF